MAASRRQPTAASDIRLVLADVDGTLVTRDKRLTDRAVAAVHALRQRGIRFAVTSGRPPKGIAMLIGPLQLDTPLAGFNGGLVVEPDFSVLHSLTLPSEVVRQATALMRTRGVDLWIYTGNDWFVPDAGGNHVAREQGTVQFPPEVSADVLSLTDGVVKITAVSDDTEAMKKLEQDVRSALGASASVFLSQPYYLDVTPPEANKGSVVRTLSDLLHVPSHQIATLGDQPNDIPMFSASGLSVAMGQASDAVKQEADFVTASCEDEGFALAVERHILGAG